MHHDESIRQELPSIIDQRDGKDVVLYTLPETKNPELDSVLVFSLHKAGTILLAKLTSELCARVGLTWVSFHGKLFQQGIAQKDYPPSVSDIFLERGYCYGAMPTFPDRFEIPIFGTAKSILLVRDPRDMLVSLYYSIRYSHPEPTRADKGDMKKLPGREDARKMDIDEYVLGAIGTYKKNMNKYMHVAENDTVKVFRYEDVIYDKARWLADICDHFGWHVSAEIQKTIVAKHDVIPRREDQTEHVRQVHPGNFKKKLKIETIRSIEDKLAEEMAYFGYKRYKKSWFRRNSKCY